MELARYLPCLRWLRRYSGSDFRGDLASGLTIGFMLVPQGMAYAMVAGLPPVYGLYASLFPPLVYALLGTSNKVSTGPVALDAILIITGLSALAAPGSDQYLELAFALALMVGLMQLLLGLMRFGFLVNFLSNPVISGYTSAAALIIIIGQLEGLVGTGVEGSHPLASLAALLRSVTDWHLLTCLTGLASMGFILATRKYAPRAPYAILLVITGMALSGLLDLRNMGVSVVDSIPQGLPDIALPSLDASQWQALLPTALTVSLMGYIGTISIAKSVETPRDKYLSNPNGELIALGMQERGCVGAVVDGGVRDLRWLRQHDFPVFARYRTPVQSIGRWSVTGWQEPVSISGATMRWVRVNPGPPATSARGARWRRPPRPLPGRR